MKPARSIALFCVLLLGCTPRQDRLEAERAATTAQLEQLPRLKIDTLCPTLGYSSQFVDSKDEGDQITITFPEPKPLDTVVLVPLNFLNSRNEYKVIGFPVRFKIEAQTVHGRTNVIADYTAADFPPPGITPVVFPSTDGQSVKALTLTVTHLAQAQIWYPNKYVFMLNELLAFSGDENIALNAAVSSKNPLHQTLKFDPAFLVDGYSYFQPYAPAKNNPFWNFRSHQEEVQLLFDLGEEQSLNEARIYPNDFTAEFSHIHSAAIGFPMQIELRLSSDPSFEHADSIVIAESKYPVNMSSAPLCRKFSPISGRYVQLILRNGRRDPQKKARILSLSEVELLNNGVNLLSGIPFQTAKPMVLGKPTIIHRQWCSTNRTRVQPVLSPALLYRRTSRKARYCSRMD